MFSQLRGILGPLGVKVHVFDLPMWQGRAACLHLLSLMSPLDRDLALIHPPLMPVALYQLLRERGIECLEASEKEFRASGGLSVNVLALGPRRMCDAGRISADAADHEGCRVRGDLLCGGCAVPAVRGWADVSDVAGLAAVGRVADPGPVVEQLIESGGG